jgi:hypothetical protein
VPFMSSPVILLLITSMQGVLFMIRIYWMLLVLDHLHVRKKKLNGIFSIVFRKILKDGRMRKEESQA